MNMNGFVSKGVWGIARCSAILVITVGFISIEKCSSFVYLWHNAPRAMVDVDVGIYPRINDPNIKCI